MQKKTCKRLNVFSDQCAKNLLCRFKETAISNVVVGDYVTLLNEVEKRIKYGKYTFLFSAYFIIFIIITIKSLFILKKC